MQLMSKFIIGFRFLLCVFDIYTKYAWVIPWKDKKEITITNTFQNANQIKHGSIKALSFIIINEIIFAYSNVLNT